ncbi:MAG: hypothetical protein K5883_07625 [Pseudobutyrivibrio sp.]|nr:hypothetical protein [Pseudobutyrivibrio sp.]
MIKFSKKAEDCIVKAKNVGWDISLDTIKELLDLLDNPQDKIKTVHVTGTNGKGSTCTFLNQILIEAGYKVGKYMSPAVADERERYTINNEWISEQDYADIIDAIAVAADIVENKGFRYPSLFELETVMAFLFFEKSCCDIAIIEVGMGGMKDATNVMKAPLACLFTPIGLEHKSWLGDTLKAIVANKSGIIKDNAFVVSAIQEDEVSSVLKDAAKAHMSDIVFAKPLSENIFLGLTGTYQLQNAAVAKECALYLRTKGFNIADAALEAGLKNARLPFRFETVFDSPKIVLDGAHNLPAVLALKDSINKFLDKQKLTFVISVLADKDFDKMCQEILPLASNVVLVQSNSPRAMDINDMKAIADKHFDGDISTASTFDEAGQLAISCNNDVIVCFGTFTFLKEMRDTFHRIIEFM